MFQEKWNIVLGEIAECSRRSGTLSGERVQNVPGEVEHCLGRNSQNHLKEKEGFPPIHTNKYYIVKRRAGTVFTTTTGRAGRVDNLNMQCRRDLLVGDNFLCSRFGSERSHSFE
jgi:hypothetical protein